MVDDRAHARPRRITDDLAWLRQAMEDPGVHGLRPIPRRKVVAAWVPDDPAFERLARLRERHVLEAAGFQLTDVPGAARVAPPRFERQPAEAPAEPDAAPASAAGSPRSARARRPGSAPTARRRRRTCASSAARRGRRRTPPSGCSSATRRRGCG